MLEKVKLALRISHSYLDSDITDAINAARAELIRSGVPSDVANDDTNPLIVSAVKTYCKMVFAKDTDTAEDYDKSWKYQQEVLRKSTFETPYVPSTTDEEGGEAGV